MTTRTTAIEVTGLRKAYGAQQVITGLDLTVAAGTVYALLGPNGAGKTTTVRIMSTLVSADSGAARVAGYDVGHDADRVRTSIGVTGQFSAVDELLTGRENLQLMADLGHLDRRHAHHVIAQLVERFDLAGPADRCVATYSGGLKRRLDLAMTLVLEPRLIFLDEPTTGLDPRSRRNLWRIVRELVTDGVTVFLTTQYLEEADQLADRIGVLDEGHLVAEGTAAELKQLVPGGRVELQVADGARLAELALALPDAVPNAETLTVNVPHDGSLTALRGLLDGIDDGTVTGLTVHTPDLDDVFLALTGRSTQTQPVDGASA